MAGPFDAWLVLRGLKTLAVRMEQHSANAEQVAGFLAEHAAVSEVFYPGLESHAQYDVAKRQMRRFGGMVSFRVRAASRRPSTPAAGPRCSSWPSRWAGWSR